MRYSIRADREGISQFNGFFRQAVRWSQVASYYLDFNPRYHAERSSHVEPVLLNARGEIVFQGFAHVLKSTNKIITQRRELWLFVETQLVGKRVEKPFTVADAQIQAARSFETVNWAAKSWRWRIARVAQLMIYATFLLALALAPSYYVLTNDIQIGELTKLLLISWMMMWFIGPLLVRAIQISLRERRLLREAKARKDETI